MKTPFGLQAGVGMVLALFLGTAAAQKADRPNALPPGHTWVNQLQNSGSFGTGADEVQTQTVQVTWEGREFIGLKSAQGTTLMHPTGEWFGVLAPDGRLAVRWDPPISYDWPLEVGKVSVRQYQVKIPASDQPVAMEYRMEVEAVEDVTVPAGTFRTFRVRSTDSLGNVNLEWYSPDLKLWVKRSMERTDKHGQGPGRREIVLKSQDIRAPQ